MSKQRNRRNTRRGRAKRWVVLVSQSGRLSERMHRGAGLFFGVSVCRSFSRPGQWRVVWYAPKCRIRIVSHRREALKIAEHLAMRR